jgi:hypothetical protein
MEDTFAVFYLQDIAQQFHRLKRLADRAISQLDDQEWFITLYDDANSVAIILKHVAGNMCSRWTDFFTTDGEKPDRHRDTEFELEQDDTKAVILARWETGWRILFGVLESLTVDDLERTITIRREPHLVPQAIHRQLSHYAYHVGQLVFLCRCIKGGDWQSLSIPRGKSSEFNQTMRERQRRNV